MVAEQRDMKVPTALIPHCPICGKPMTMNLRADNTFVEDEAGTGQQSDMQSFCGAIISFMCYF